MAPVIDPLTIVDLLSFPIEVPSSAAALAFHVLARVNITGDFVKHPASIALSIRFPAAFVDAAIKVNNLAVSLFDELTVLAVIEVATRVHELAYTTDKTILESTLVYDTVCQQQSPVSVGLVIAEGSDVDIAILEPHFTVLSHIVSPRSCELAPILPRHGAVTFSLTSFPLSFISRLFVIAAVVHH